MCKLLLLFLCALSVAVTASTGNNRPIIGISAWPSNDWPNATYYLPSEYVKWIEAGGARVAPLLMSNTDEQLVQLVRQLNGVVFIGGSGDITEGSPIRHFVEVVYNEVIALNDAGIHMPIWATCLGFEAVASVMSKGDTILGNSNSTDVCLPIELSSECSKWIHNECRLFGPSFPSSLVQLVSSPKEPILYNYHQKCVTPESFNSHPAIASFARIVATSVDLNGMRFIAAYEAKNYPIYASQWHPEKSPYEWQPGAVSHTWQATSVSSYLAHFFILEAMKNDNHFTDPDEEAAALIYNYQPVFAARYIPNYHFTQVYYF